MFWALDTVGGAGKSKNRCFRCAKISEIWQKTNGSNADSSRIYHPDSWKFSFSLPVFHRFLIPFYSGDCVSWRTDKADSTNKRLLKMAVLYPLCSQKIMCVLYFCLSGWIVSSWLSFKRFLGWLRPECHPFSLVFWHLDRSQVLYLLFLSLTLGSYHLKTNPQTSYLILFQDPPFCCDHQNGEVESTWIEFNKSFLRCASRAVMRCVAHNCISVCLFSVRL